jgi:hypothetical protein
LIEHEIRDAALAHLGINPSKPAVEFEIGLPKDGLSAFADTQVAGKFSIAERCGAVRVTRKREFRGGARIRLRNLQFETLLEASNFGQRCPKRHESDAGSRYDRAERMIA